MFNATSDPGLWIFPTHEDTYFRMPHISMRKDNYTLIGTFPEKPDSLNLLNWMKTSEPVNYELYDLSVDIEQARNISDKNTENFKMMINEMKKLWLEIREEGPSFN